MNNVAKTVSYVLAVIGVLLLILMAVDATIILSYVGVACLLAAVFFYCIGQIIELLYKIYTIISGGSEIEDTKDESADGKTKIDSTS